MAMTVPRAAIEALDPRMAGTVTDEMAGHVAGRDAEGRTHRQHHVGHVLAHALTQVPGFRGSRADRGDVVGVLDGVVHQLGHGIDRCRDVGGSSDAGGGISDRSSGSVSRVGAVTEKSCTEAGRARCLRAASEDRPHAEVDTVIDSGQMDVHERVAEPVGSTPEAARPCGALHVEPMGPGAADRGDGPSAAPPAAGAVR